MGSFQAFSLKIPDVPTDRDREIAGLKLIFKLC